MDIDCRKCELTHCVCRYESMAQYVVGQQSQKFVGIANGEQENNCFLSVVLQALLNVECFSDMLLEHCIEHKRCLVCVLKKIRQAIRTAELEALDSINLAGFRSDINQITNGSIFQFGSTGDAMEAIEIFFNFIHYSSFGMFDRMDLLKNENCSGECSAHMICFNKLIEKWGCGCKTNSKENLTMSFALVVNSEWFFRKVKDSTSGILYHVDYLDLADCLKHSDLINYKHTFSEIFRDKVCEFIKKNTICEDCNTELRVKIVLENEPKMMIFHVNWNDFENIDVINIIQFYISLQGKVKLNELFETDSELEMGMRGIIVYLRSHYVYFILGDDFSWYKIDDNICFLVGAGRWYDVILNLVYMKGIIVGLVYEELHIADLSLYNLEVLFLEKLGYMLYRNYLKEAGMIDSIFRTALNPRITKTPEQLAEVECAYCKNLKTIGEICSRCGFDPNQLEWICENKKCNKANNGLNFMCDYCDAFRFEYFGEEIPCITCRNHKNEAICRSCDILFKCSRCGKNKSPLQSCFCKTCKDPCRDGYCEVHKSYEMVCKKCVDF